MNKQQFELALAKKVATFVDDPLGFVLWAFPWGEKGTPLEKFSGPDKWQSDYLSSMGTRIKARPDDFRLQYSTSSGHG